MENKNHLGGIELRSEEVQEILSRPPIKILWIGYIIFAFSIVTIIFAYQKFKTESEIYKMSLELDIPSQNIIVENDAVINQVFVDNNQHLEIGTEILLIDSVLVKSAVKGKVTFQNSVLKHEIVKKGEKLLTIQPDRQMIRKGVIYISRKTKFPYKVDQLLTFYVANNKNLTFSGTIHSISDVPNDKGLYYTEILFSQQKVQHFISYLKGNAIDVEIR